MSRRNQAALSRAIQSLLRPVLSFCLRHSLRLRDILELMKVSLVTYAIDELKREQAVVSASKISLMTGVHRKDVAALLECPEPREIPTSVFLRVIGQWRTDKRFLTKDGKPRSLCHVGRDSEFVELVGAVHKELNPYSVLFELLRVGMVEEKGDQLHLLASEYIPYGKIEERFALVASDVNDLVRAAEENILDPQATPNLHLATSYDNVNPEDLPKIRKWFMEQGAELHERARAFLSSFDKDINPAIAEEPGGARVIIGTFSLTEVPVVKKAAAEAVAAADAVSRKLATDR